MNNIIFFVTTNTTNNAMNDKPNVQKLIQSKIKQHEDTENNNAVVYKKLREIKSKNP